ncbi:CDGSH iron-sulfur domain-containing protein [Bradyrhizobium sp.]|uniref:CDGSH iron-sulfur domain-containing protein n=1 Tax=Bradyrhizobium sp. TaxID=376 RepID=UPI003C3FADD1
MSKTRARVVVTKDLVVSADGFEDEVRNRVTLCRCGQSQNKPFCDGTHAQTKFKDT